MSWATDHDASIEKLVQVQGSLTVALIMVRREDFLTCSPDETADQVKSRNVDYFSFIPVQDENDRILGLYDAQRWFNKSAPDTPVGEDYISLSEDIVIGADGSIFDFIKQADVNQTNLVIAGNRVAGLVSLSDLQQLPVRAALFALMTSLEMAMAHAIERKWPRAEDWLSLLSGRRKIILEDLIKAAGENDTFISEIAFAQICDKADLVRKGELLTGSSTALKAQFRAIEKLRNDVAHGNQFADTPDAAKNVCETVRSMISIKEELLKVPAEHSERDCTHGSI